MGIFSKKNEELPSKDYERLSNRITDVASAVKVIESQIESIKANINSMNGRINRKSKEEVIEDLNTPFPFRNGGLS